VSDGAISDFNPSTQVYDQLKLKNYIKIKIRVKVKIKIKVKVALSKVLCYVPVMHREHSMFMLRCVCPYRYDIIVSLNGQRSLFISPVSCTL
jgi:hypothetical protein